MTTREEVFKSALLAEKNNINVIPPSQDGNKRPFVEWKKYQKVKITEEQLKKWYSTDDKTGVGWICGKISNNLEVIDFDDRAIYGEFKKLLVGVGLEKLIEKIENGYCEQSPNGFHWPYRCEKIEGNKKLAQIKTETGWRSIIETRGEGGYIIAAPTFGRVNNSGEYKIISGSVETIVTLTIDERELLHQMASTLDENKKTEDKNKIKSHCDSGRPGDDFINKTSWDEILIPFGWTKVFERFETTFWRRPEKTHGLSATTNHNNSDLLYVFSTSTIFESEKGYNKFSAYAILNHNGNFHEAASELYLQGYGQEENNSVDISGILNQSKKKNVIIEEKLDSFPKHLLRVPGLIGEIKDYIDKTSYKKQPILSLAASIAAVSTVISRRVRTIDFVFPNLYILGVGCTGCGKERAREVVQEIFIEAGCGELVSYDDLASDAAINTALTKTPACLFLIDEVGRFLKAINSPRAPQHLVGIVTTLIKLFSKSRSVYHGKSYANTKNDIEVHNPHLNIYGTTVPTKLYEALDRGQIEDGFLSRFLIFESEDKNPKLISCENLLIPNNILNQIKKWQVQEGNLENLYPDLKIIYYTDAAKKIINELDERIHILSDKIIERDGDPGIISRVPLIARKLALIRACGNNFQAEITELDSLWACEIAFWIFEHTKKMLEKNLFDSDYEKNLKNCVEYIKRKKYVSKSELHRNLLKFHRGNPSLKASLLADLENHENIEKQEEHTGKKPKVVYVYKKTTCG